MFDGSDNGVRYADTFPGGVSDVLASLNVSRIADRLLRWQVRIGLGVL